MPNQEFSKAKGFLLILTLVTCNVDTASKEKVPNRLEELAGTVISKV